MSVYEKETQKKTFKTEEVLTASTNKAMPNGDPRGVVDYVYSEIRNDEKYQDFKYEEMYDFASDYLKKSNPKLAKISGDDVTPENVHDFSAEKVKELGPTIEITPAKSKDLDEFLSTYAREVEVEMYQPQNEVSKSYVDLDYEDIPVSTNEPEIKFSAVQDEENFKGEKLILNDPELILKNREQSIEEYRLENPISEAAKKEKVAEKKDVSEVKIPLEDAFDTEKALDKKKIPKYYLKKEAPISEKTISNEQLYAKINELKESVSSLESKVEELKTQVTNKKTKTTEKTIDDKKKKIDFSAVSEFKNSKVAQAKETIKKHMNAAEEKFSKAISSTKDASIKAQMRVDNKVQIANTYAEMMANNKIVAGVKGASAVANEHLVKPISEKAVKGYHKVAEVQKKTYNKYKELENAINLKTEAVMSQDGTDAPTKKEKYKAAFETAKKSSKEKVVTAAKESKLGQLMEKSAKAFQTKASSIQSTYKANAEAVMSKNESAKEKIQDLRK